MPCTHLDCALCSHSDFWESINDKLEKLNREETAFSYNAMNANAV